MLTQRLTLPRHTRRAAVLAVSLLATLLALLILNRPAQAQDNDTPGAAQADLTANQADLRINEFMATNQTAYPDPDEPDQFPDWVEIYNPTNAPVSLDGLSLTDREGQAGRGPIANGVVVDPLGYVVLLLDGDLEQGPLHVDLGLNDEGEFVGLYVLASNQQIDGYTFGPQTPDVSMGRNPDGTGDFQVLSGPTPGRSNQDNPPVIGPISRTPEQPQVGESVVISATITDNESVVAASVVYTTPATAPTTVAMTASGSSYQATLPAFPAGTFVRYVVRARDNDNNLTVSRWGGYVVGYEAPVLKINEFVAENFGAVEDRDDPGEYPDWMELYNPGDAPVSLNGLYLTDNLREPDKFAIPNGYTIAARSFLLIYLDNDPEQGPNIHTNFSLDKNGESLALTGARGTVVIDQVTFGQQYDNVARGRYPDGQGGFVELVCTTPGRANMLCDEKNYLPTVGGQ